MVLGVAPVALLALPASPASAHDKSYNCYDWYDNGAHESEITGVGYTGSSLKSGSSKTYFHPSSQNECAGWNGWTAVVSHYHYRWLSGNWAYCDDGYDSDPNGFAWFSSACNYYNEEHKLDTGHKIVAYQTETTSGEVHW